MSGADSQIDHLLEQTVYMRGANRPFGELTLEDVRNRADELRAAIGWGPMARVAPVAHAWRELALEMEREDAGTVTALPRDFVVKLAPRLWVVPPG
jgi:hypothetical protein